jgi:hypothetical protein
MSTALLASAPDYLSIKRLQLIGGISRNVKQWISGFSGPTLDGWCGMQGISMAHPTLSARDRYPFVKLEDIVIDETTIHPTGFRVQCITVPTSQIRELSTRRVVTLATLNRGDYASLAEIVAKMISERLSSGCT